MTGYRDLPNLLMQRDFLEDGGLETALIFLRGIDLLHFASFPLLDTDEGRAELAAYFEPFIETARSRGIGFLLDTPTWRASPNWGAQLGYDQERLMDLNKRAVGFARNLASAWETASSPIVINGVIGPRGDGYRDGNMDPDEAEAYHGLQVQALGEAGADLVSAITMNNVGEAIGIARAAKAHGVPCFVSFTLETDGRLVNGTSLADAIAQTDAATDGHPLFYMINCAHPAHFDSAIDPSADWARRLGGIRANASMMSHEELDNSETLDFGDPADLGQRYRALRAAFPSIRVMGGCCGTDHRHIVAICEACFD